MYIHNVDLPLNSRPVYPIAFSIFLLDVKWASHINLKSKPSLLSYFFIISTFNPIAHYLGSLVYLHTEARTIFNNQIMSVLWGNIFNIFFFYSANSLYYDLQNLSNQVAHYHFLSCPSSLWFYSLLSATLAYFDTLYTERIFLPQGFCICCSLSSKLLAPYIHMVNFLTLFMSFSSVTFCRELTDHLIKN